MFAQVSDILLSPSAPLDNTDLSKEQPRAVNLTSTSCPKGNEQRVRVMESEDEVLEKKHSEIDIRIDFVENKTTTKPPPLNCTETYIRQKYLCVLQVLSLKKQKKTKYNYSHKQTKEKQNRRNT